VAELEANASAILRATKVMRDAGDVEKAGSFWSAYKKLRREIRRRSRVG
jgi:hypothetical protein